MGFTSERPSRIGITRSNGRHVCVLEQSCAEHWKLSLTAQGSWALQQLDARSHASEDESVAQWPQFLAGGTNVDISERHNLSAQQTGVRNKTMSSQNSIAKAKDAVVLYEHGQWRIQKCWKGGGSGRETIYQPILTYRKCTQWSICLSHEKSSFLKKILTNRGGRPHCPLEYDTAHRQGAHLTLIGL